MLSVKIPIETLIGCIKRIQVHSSLVSKASIIALNIIHANLVFNQV